MFPLLQRDGQTITYFALSIIFLVMAVLVLDVKEYGAPIKSTVRLLCDNFTNFGPPTFSGKGPIRSLLMVVFRKFIHGD